MSIQQYLYSLERQTSSKPNRADRWYNLALVHEYLGEHREAIAVLRRALKTNPHYAEAAILRCFVLGETGEMETAFREFRQLFARSPEDFSVVFPLGIFCMRHGWKREGAMLLLRAEAARPKVPYVLLHSAAALLETGDESASSQRLQRARAMSSSTGLEALLGEGAAGEASLEVCRRWENPGLARIHVLLSEFHRENGDLGMAESELRRGVSLYPGHSVLTIALSRFLVALGRNPEAMRWLSIAVQMDPGSHEAHFELSFLHAELGELAKSLDCLRSAADLRPLFPDYLYQLGVLLLDLGHTQEAIEQFERVRVLSPAWGYCKLHLASAYMESGAPEKALEALGEGSFRKLPEARVLSATAHLQRGCAEQARAILEQVIREDSTYTDAQAVLDSLRAPAASPLSLQE